MSHPPLESTPIGTNKANTQKLHLDLTPVGTKTPDPKPIKLPTESPKCKEKLVKECVPKDLESNPSSSDSPSS